MSQVTKDRELKISRKSILKEALALLKKEGSEEVRDEYGVIGYYVNEHILVAKSMPYRGYVSMHRSLLKKAALRRKKILFYIHEDESFHEFEPSYLCSRLEFRDSDVFINHRRNVPMVNFPLSMGTRFLLIPGQEPHLF